MHGARLSVNLPQPAACCSILASPLPSGTQSVPKGGRELGMGGQGWGYLAEDGERPPASPRRHLSPTLV